MVSIMENLLKVVSGDLYGENPHFIQELLQNADDSSYTTEPALKITFRSHATQASWLQIDTNEVGFSKEDVAAICSVSNSTKSGQTHSRASTGEKGIGFKSVFKVANRVYISSRGYTFMFDKDLPLGMINPIWTVFPGETTPELTSIGLELSNDQNAIELIDYLRGLDASLLLFLRKVRKISIELAPVGDTSSSITLQRKDVDGDGRFQIRRLCTAEGDLEYLVHRYRVSHLPRDTRRPNYTHSDLLLAFPPPPLRGEQVFAFLPISDSGLDFALQGDFLLVANRQSIHPTAHWNCHLRAGVTEAFVQSVERFNSSDHLLKYYWPLYMPTDKVHKFFQPCKESIHTVLKCSRVLLSQSVERPYALPSELLFVHPGMYADCNGIPLTACTLHSATYLSSSYPECTIGPLRTLGVVAMTDDIFLSHLQQLISEAAAEFYSRTSQWHSQLARVLLRLIVDAPEGLRQVAYNLPIVPLSNGTWVSARDGPMLPQRTASRPNALEDSANSALGEITSSDAYDNVGGRSTPTILAEDVPGRVLIIEETAAADDMRRSLFAQLKVVTMSTTWTCEHLSSCHNSSSFNPQNWTLEQLLSHTKYIYHARWRPERFTDLWFATSDGGRCKGSQAYCAVPTSEDSVYARISEVMISRYPTVDHAYMQETEAGWMLFLQNTLHVSAVPRLVQEGEFHQGKTSDLSEEFKYILKECQFSDVVQLLLENWHAYSRWFDADITQFTRLDIRESREKLLLEIQESMVKTQHGMRRLGSISISGIDSYVEVHIADLPVLTLEATRDKITNQKLHLLGIHVDSDVEFYTHCLEHLHAKDEPETAVLSHIYEKIQDLYDANEVLVESTFSKKKLIYVKSPYPRKEKLSASRASQLQAVRSSEPIGWLDVSEGSLLKDLIQSDYPQATRFFQGLLGGERLLLGPLLAKASRVDMLMNTAEIATLFANISDILGLMGQINVAKATKFIHDKPVLPIFKVSTESQDDNSYDSLVGNRDASWFIADRPHLYQSFKGKLPLLAFTVQQIRNLVIDSTVPRGPLRYSQPKTVAVLGKNEFLKASAESIVINHDFRCKDSACSGRPTKGFIHSVSSECNLQIYIEDDGKDSNLLPFDVVSEIGQYLGIKDERRRHLLYEALSNKNIRDVQQRFEADGYDVDIVKVLESHQEPHADYHVASGDLMSIPSPWQVHGSKNKGLNIDLQPKRSKLDPDRRIKMMEINMASKVSTHGVLYTQKLDPNNTLQFLGELLASRMFEKTLGWAYIPDLYWTSKLRVRAGTMPEPTTEHVASFTMDEPFISQAVTTRFSSQLGDQQAQDWGACSPTYHFLVAPSSGDWEDSFVWGSQKVELMRRFHLSGANMKSPKDVLILLRISHIYSERPRYRFIIDPWNLVLSGQLTLPSDALFAAAIKSNAVSQHDPQNTNHSSTSDKPIEGESRQNENEPSRLPRDVPDMATTLRGPKAKLDSTPYIYRPLCSEQFRLFTLFPAADTQDPLRGMICSHSIKVGVPYESVSYTWGSDAQTMHSISMPDGELQVRDSLKTVLTRLRKKEGSVVLWIDAICIDQENPHEKTHQIRKLPQIFQRATCTLAVISTEEKYHAAMETLMQIRGNAVYGYDSERWPDNLAKIPASWAGKDMPPITEDVWDSVVQFFKVAWFQRAWIVQEVIAAPSVKVVCGQWMVDWSDLFFTMELVDKRFRRTSKVDISAWKSFKILGEHREWEATKRRWPLLLLLETFRHTESGFMRDRFFSLLGLANDGNLAEFEPDYASPFEAIVCKFARTFIQRGFGIHLLCRAGLGPQLDRFPSWVPDWTILKSDSLSKSSERGVVYNASSYAEPKIGVVSESRNIIEVRAIQVDIITHVSGCFNRPHEPARLEKYFKEIDDLIDAHLRTRFSREKRDVLKWRVPVAGAEHPKIATGGDINLRDSYNALRTVLKGLKKKTGPSAQYLREDTGERLVASSDGVELTRVQGRSLNYHALVQDSIKDWKFFVTQSGTCGIAPGLVKAGDKVHIVAGSRTPFVMRMSFPEQDLSKLIGECYVYGMMNGECVHADTRWSTVKLH
ncbi:hypothetical protein ST47_g8701 [Ascochyta rabiei]|uniref:Heterokaryon incompatibility domain-containing protein n=1 Tax=Didymella rabiei TaxID=5454 RepID=A0A162YNB1_DIDRA|nr:hypothetical protein ST47_g8701 [Ascochyta rabiei]